MDSWKVDKVNRLRRCGAINLTKPQKTPLPAVTKINNKKKIKKKRNKTKRMKSKK